MEHSSSSPEQQQPSSASTAAATSSRTTSSSSTASFAASVSVTSTSTSTSIKPKHSTSSLFSGTRSLSSSSSTTGGSTTIAMGGGGGGCGENLPPRTLARVEQDVRDLVKSPPEGVRLVVDEESGMPGSLAEIVAEIEGPEHTPYHKRFFQLKLVLSTDFPSKPPRAYFLTKIYHPNVDPTTGAICVNTLKKDWTPTTSLSHVLTVIRCLMIGGDGLAAAPQAQVPTEEDDLPVSDEDVGSDRNLEKTCTKFGKCVGGGGFYHRAIAAWPRTSALTFGVVVPLFLLVAVSVFFGYFLAQLEGPGEIVQNNKVISTQIALALQDQLIGNITETLPYICACTYLADKKQQGIFDERMEEYELCLWEQGNQSMPSSYPSFQPSNQPSFTPSMNPTARNETLTLATNVTSTILPIIESSQSISSNNITGSKNSTSNEPIVCKKPKSLQTQTIEFALQRISLSQFKRCDLNLNLPNISSEIFGNGNACTEAGKTKLLAFEDSLNSSTGDLLMDLLTEMKTCGNEALEIADDYKLSRVITRSLTDASPSWNWIRCNSRNKNTTMEEHLASNLNQLFNPWADVSHLNPFYQEAEAVGAWMKSQQELYCNYVADGLAEGRELSDARYDALERSFADANGFDDEDCYPNMWTGSWFWFTVMTTVGYGNPVPATAGGRIMIFTLGFVSILFFGFVLGKAGSIVVAIVEDFLLRTHPSFLKRNWIQVIIWGALYYLWSLLIACYYVYWNMIRTGESVTLYDAYWSTTVGLGDYYIDNAAIIGIDLLVLPLLILYGFVLLAAFLTALGGLVQASDDGSDFAQKLAAEESLFSCFPRWCQRDAEFDAHISARSSIGSVRKPHVVQNDENELLNDSVEDAVTNAIPVLNGENHDGASSASGGQGQQQQN